MLELDVRKWAEQQFGTCQLGDRRRTARAVQYAAQMAADPDSSTLAQTETWGELKAAYRLFDQEDVTFRGLAQPHWQLTRASFAGRAHVLLLDDTTDVIFNNRKSHLIQQAASWVIRAAQLTRTVLTEAGEPAQIKHLLAALPLAGTYELEVRASAKQPARTAHIEVRFARFTMPRPKMTSRFGSRAQEVDRDAALRAEAADR